MKTFKAAAVGVVSQGHVGGVWKTTDGETYLENVSDGFFHTSAVGTVAEAVADHNVVYAGMG